MLPDMIGNKTGWRFSSNEMLYIKRLLSSQGVKFDIIVNPFELKRKQGNMI
jgi:hypothetical protein